MSAELHIVVACAERKRNSAGAPVRLGSVKAQALSERFQTWWSRLSRARAVWPADQLYIGDHWAVARDLPRAAQARGFAPTLWVASAGYGLVHAETPLAAYSATFAPHSPDAVARGADDPLASSRWWWRALSRAPLANGMYPRSLAGVARVVSKTATFVVVGSPAYVGAMSEDLVELASTSPAELLLVTTSHGSFPEQLKQHLIPTVGALRLSLGGALTSLHVRVARELLQRLGPRELTAKRAREHVLDLVARAPSLPCVKRAGASDEQIRVFVRKHLKQDPTATHTRLLRDLRARGIACEQSRFRSLFLDVISA